MKQWSSKFWFLNMIHAQFECSIYMLCWSSIRCWLVDWGRFSLDRITYIPWNWFDCLYWSIFRWFNNYWTYYILHNNSENKKRKIRIQTESLPFIETWLITQFLVYRGLEANVLFDWNSIELLQFGCTFHKTIFVITLEMDFQTQLGILWQRKKIFLKSTAVELEYFLITMTYTNYIYVLFKLHICLFHLIQS